MLVELNLYFSNAENKKNRRECSLHISSKECSIDHSRGFCPWNICLWREDSIAFSFHNTCFSKWFDIRKEFWSFWNIRIWVWNMSACSKLDSSRKYLCGFISSNRVAWSKGTIIVPLDPSFFGGELYIRCIFMVWTHIVVFGVFSKILIVTWECSSDESDKFTSSYVVIRSKISRIFFYSIGLVVLWIFSEVICASFKSSKHKKCSDIIIERIILFCV